MPARLIPTPEQQDIIDFCHFTGDNAQALNGQSAH
jgi:hypothetical protein